MKFSSRDPKSLVYSGARKQRSLAPNSERYDPNTQSLTIGTPQSPGAVATLPQGLSTTSSPTFAGLTDTGTLAHTGSTLGVFGKTPAVQQTGGVATASGTYGAPEQAMLQKVYDTLRTYGFLT